MEWLEKILSTVKGWPRMLFYSYVPVLSTGIKLKNKDLTLLTVLSGLFAHVGQFREPQVFNG